MCEECLEGFVRVIVDVDVPSLEEGRMFGVVEFLGNIWVGEVVFPRILFSILNGYFFYPTYF